MKAISKFHFITSGSGKAEHLRWVRLACENGVDWIQLRMKNIPTEEMRATAKEALQICRNHDAQLIINDHVSLVKEIGADGVHLGKDDMSITKARNILGPDLIIGGSTNTELDILERNEEQVDYIGLGPLRFTSTRDNLNPVLGFEPLVRAARLSKVTVVAIGGIQVADAEDLIKKGIYGVAVSSAITLAAEPARALNDFLNVCNTSLV